MPAKKDTQSSRQPRLAEGVRYDLTRAVARWENEGGADREAEPSDLGRTAFLIDPAPPFRLDLSVWALRRRDGNTVDRWDGRTYRRALALADATIELSVTRAEGQPGLSLAVALASMRPNRSIEEDARTSIKRMLGLDLDLSSFYSMTEGDSVIGHLVTHFRGLKPPRFPTVFESLLNAIACQQLSLEAGLAMLNRLAAAYGRTISTDETSLHAFPSPHDLAGLEPQALRNHGFSMRKASTIIDISQSIVAGDLDLEGLQRVTDDEAVSRLSSLKGIGRWSAEYVLLRGLGRLHVFPGDDVGARNNLARRLGLKPPLDYHAVGRAVSRWRPYAGLVYFHLLLDRLEAMGELAPTAPAVPGSFGHADSTST